MSEISSQQRRTLHWAARAPVSHRLYVWRYARFKGRWPTLDEWRFIILGRWPGF